jgi:hypothetical protein
LPAVPSVYGASTARLKMTQTAVTRVTPAASALRYTGVPVIGSHSLSSTISRKPLIFGYLRRLKKNGRRTMRIEYALIALLVAFAGLQAYLVFGAKGI